MQGRVERAFKQWNGILRDYIRNETALRLTVGSESQMVPVRVVDGMPRPFADIVKNFQGIEWLLLNRSLVESAELGAGFLGQHLDDAKDFLGTTNNLVRPRDIERVQTTAKRLLEKLDKVKAIKSMLEIEEDVLGAYFYRVPEVRLYWMVIGIVATMLNVSPEALTIVVLAHELAHAYTHLGRDIDNEQWTTSDFAAADLDIVEGLAQFYTGVVCRNLASRYPEAIRAYEALLGRQGKAYRAHLKWVEGDERGGEIVRVAMIQCRSLGITDAKVFGHAIDRQRKQVRGKGKRGHIKLREHSTAKPASSPVSSDQPSLLLGRE
jgi:hypothetical protein